MLGVVKAPRHLSHQGFDGHPLLKSFPLLAREVKPWPGEVDVEGLPGDDDGNEDDDTEDTGSLL